MEAREGVERRGAGSRGIRWHAVVGPTVPTNGTLAHLGQPESLTRIGCRYPSVSAKVCSGWELGMGFSENVMEEEEDGRGSRMGLEIDWGEARRWDSKFSYFLPPPELASLQSSEVEFSHFPCLPPSTRASLLCILFKNVPMEEIIGMWLYIFNV